MHILLKTLLKEVEETEEEKSPLKVQIYCDMDGVLVDLENGFKAISGGLSPKEYEAKHGKNTFWKVIDQIDPNTKQRKYPKFWENLEPMPRAKELWNFIKENFKDPKPVILSAGKGDDIYAQKKAWIRKHIDPSVKVTLAEKGTLKSNYIEKFPSGEKVSHVLVDDTPENKTNWDNKELGRIMIEYQEKNIKSVKDQLMAFKNNE